MGTRVGGVVDPGGAELVFAAGLADNVVDDRALAPSVSLLPQATTALSASAEAMVPTRQLRWRGYLRRTIPTLYGEPPSRTLECRLRTGGCGTPVGRGASRRDDRAQATTAVPGRRSADRMRPSERRAPAPTRCCRADSSRAAVHGQVAASAVPDARGASDLRLDSWSVEADRARRTQRVRDERGEPWVLERVGGWECPEEPRPRKG